MSIPTEARSSGCLAAIADNIETAVPIPIKHTQAALTAFRDEQAGERVVDGRYHPKLPVVALHKDVGPVVVSEIGRGGELDLGHRCGAGGEPFVKPQAHLAGFIGDKDDDLR